MHLNPREEHEVGGDDGLSCGSYHSARVFTLVEDIESRANALHYFVALFLLDAWRLWKDHQEPNVMSLELGVMPYLEEDSFIVFLMFHGGLGACVDARVEDLGFKESNPRMDMQT
jgi:hypothetical protein